MKILAIETSCDETSVAVVEDGTIVRSLVINSQIDIHKAFGGVVPEIAARSHIEVMLPVVTQALEQAFEPGQRATNKAANKNPAPSTLPLSLFDQIDAIAVTQGPGLLGSLLIGVLTARTLAWSLNKPLYPIHHILGHVYANWLLEEKIDEEQVANDNELASSNNSMTSKSKLQTASVLPIVNRKPLIFPKTQPEFPVLALIVSGGHTQLMLATDHTSWQVIGRTQDDAVGEAFDKVAKVLGLPYPGGISVEKLAQIGNSHKYHLPTPNVAATYDFSFSGLKTAVLRAVQRECGVTHEFPSFELAARLNEAQKADFAASFVKTSVDYLVSKTKLAFEEFSPKTVIIGGGVAASSPLRDALSKALPLEIMYAPRPLCTDNAAMIGARAYFQAQAEEPTDPRTLETKPSWPL